MKKYLGALIRKDLSRLKYKLGIKVNDYYTQVFSKRDQNMHCNLSIEGILSIIKSDHFIKIDDNSGRVIQLNDNYYTTAEYESNEEQLYNIQYLKTLFDEETNTTKLNIYKSIIDNEPMTYLQIAQVMNKILNIKLDIKQISHYCNDLIKLNLIVATVNSNNEKLIVKNNLWNCYKGKNPNLSSDDLSDDEIKPSSSTHNVEYSSTKEATFSYKDFYTCHPDQIFSLSPQETNFIKNSSLGRNYFENRFSFILDENEIKNNILFHLLMNKEKGLTANEICLLTDFLGKEKSLTKIFGYLEKEKLIKHYAIREGKKLEFRYVLIDEKIPSLNPRILFYADYYKTKHSHSKGNLRNEIVFPSLLINEEAASTVKDEQTPLKSNETHANDIERDFEQLNEEDFQYILKLILSTSNLDEIKKKFDLQPNTLSSSFTPYMRRQILVDFFYSLKEPVKNLSNSAFNRFIFCLNQIHHKKIMSMNDLKVQISTVLEKDKDFIIDRKTLKNLIIKLEKLRLIKTMNFELTMKNSHHLYYNHKDELKQQKLVALRRDQNESEELVAKIAAALRPGPPMNSKKANSRNQIKIEDICKELEVKADEMKQEEGMEQEKQEKQENTKRINTHSESHAPRNDNISSVKSEINYLTQKLDLSISQIERNVMKFIEKISFLILKESNLNNMKRFWENLKQIATYRHNIQWINFTLGDVKKYNTGIDTILTKRPFYQIMQRMSPKKVIMPQFMLDNFCKSSIPPQGLEVKMTSTMLRLIKDMNSIDDRIFQCLKNDEPLNICFGRSNEVDIPDMPPIPESEFLKKKKHRNEAQITSPSVIKLKQGKRKVKFSSIKGENEAKIVDILNKIYFMPMITYKKLRHIVPLSEKKRNEEAFKDVLLYLQKFDILKIRNQKFQSVIDDECSFELDENYDSFFDLKYKEAE